MNPFLNPPNDLPPTMRLQSLPSARGMAWTLDAWRLFASRPFAWVGLLAMFIMVGLLLSLLGMLGAAIATVSPPLVSLIFMVATAATQTAGVKHPLQALATFRQAGMQRARSLIALCIVYAIAMTLQFSISASLDQGSMHRLIELLAAPRTTASMRDINTVLASDAFQHGFTLRLLGTVLLSIPFWHAPALVWWGHQGVGQALFSSALGVWRSKGAYALYALTLLATAMGLMTVIGVVLSLINSASSMRVALAALSMVLAVVFYLTLWFSFVDTFGLRNPDADADKSVDAPS